VQDIHVAITAAEEAGISIEAIGDFIESQIGKISKDELLELVMGACGKFEMDQAKLDALLTHIVDTFELSQKEQRQIIKFLRETLNITKEESKHAKEMCFKKGKEAKAAREAAAN